MLQNFNRLLFAHAENAKKNAGFAALYDDLPFCALIGFRSPLALYRFHRVEHASAAMHPMIGAVCDAMRHCGVRQRDVGADAKDTSAFLR
eukprot:1713204-Pleurochrysis_carterae.AAC.1